MKRYRLEFEYLSPFTKKWESAHREVDEHELSELRDQMCNQLVMTDVRNSRILVQETSEWSEMPDGGSALGPKGEAQL